MAKIILIGIGAGVATAMLFASLASGSLIAILLFYLAPLPILIAGLGWSHWAALIAALSAAASLAAVFGAFFFAGFLAGVGLPAWWLSYLALLGRSTGPGPEHFEWYPPGQIVFWTAIIGASIVVASIPFFGFDAESFHATLQDAIEHALGLGKRAASDDAGSDASRIFDSDLLVRLAPPMVASLTTMIQVVNLWLAARIVKISGRLPRPWPELSAITFPPWAPVLLAAAIAGTFLPGIVPIVSGVFAASLMMVYAILGFAVLHVVTRRTAGRPVLLAFVYAVVLVFGWPALILSLLGLADTALDLRGRAAARPGPPQLRP